VCSPDSVLRDMIMSKPPFALAAEQAPTETDLTDYDLYHFSTYLRLLDADSAPAGRRR
jgi:hypothetical protein